MSFILNANFDSLLNQRSRQRQSKMFWKKCSEHAKRRPEFNNMTILDEWTQDSVWYNALSVFERHGIKLPTRKYFKGLIRTVCERLGVTREKIGIVAAPWATMYYKGEWRGVS